MKRSIVIVVSLATMLVVTALARQRGEAPAAHTWAANALKEPPPLAVLLEFGVKDADVYDWSGSAKIEGARVVHREGYRFRAEDKLVAPDGWQASSHRPLRGAAGQPLINKLEPIAPVGVVLHLADVTADAVISLKLAKSDTATVPLKDVVKGVPAPLWEGRAVARLVTTAAAVETAKTEDDFPAAAYGPDGTLWVAYVSYHVKEHERRIEPPMLKDQPKDFKKFDTPQFGDQIFVKFYRQGQWSKAWPLTDAKQDIARCAVAVDKDGNAWVVYSAQRDGNFDLYCRNVSYELADGGKNRMFDLGREQRLTANPGPDLTPAMCTDRDGQPWLAYQTWSADGQARIGVMRLEKDVWVPKRTLAGDKGENAWQPAVAADPSGKVAVAYDVYHRGSYDVRVAQFDVATGKHTTTAIAITPKFEARPAVAYDPAGRLWIAYEEGPEKWGKDYGAQDSNDGKPLYNERSVRVVCLDQQGALATPAELPTSKYDPPQLPFDPIKTSQFERATRYAYPKLGIDLKGRVWLSYRQSFGSRYTTHPGNYWLTFVRRLDATGWSQPVEVHHSDGLLDHRPVLLPHVSGGLLVVHNTDGRATTPNVVDNQIYASAINLPDREGLPELAALPRPRGFESAEFEREKDAVQRIRGYRIDAGGKNYHILRGEYHRHTEMSWDGGPDGSLEDMFRYAIDVAAFDWIGNGDHDNGAGREYSWWLTQKFSDAYHVARAFTPMFTYERSVAYPHGHRNVMFARRGIRTLPRLAPPEGVKKAEAGVHPDDTKMLYRYLKELDGICAVHTSATGMGTDWRDNDPVVEPIVEIYQGDRMSYEMENAPRAGYDPKSDKLPANVAGWFPKGFINLALQKGYKLSFQASSDHWSTHISYMLVLAEKHDRQGILDAVKKRHVYAATDNIILDFRSGPHIMGDEMQSSGPPTFQIAVIGTGDIAKIDILKDSRVVETWQPKGREHKSTWTDPQAAQRPHYYYVRVLQTDNEIAWGSPIWVNQPK